MTDTDAGWLARLPVIGAMPPSEAAAKLLGFDAADRLGGGPADGPCVLAEVDGDDLGGGVDGDDLAGVDTPGGDLLPGDHDDAGVAGGSLDGDRFGGRAGRRPGRAGAAEQPGLVPGQRAGPGPQQDAGGGVEEHQGVLLDPDGHHGPAGDLRGDVVPAAQADVAVLADRAVDL